MASKNHDFILKMVQLKMKELGYKLVASDDIHPKWGKAYNLIPPTIIHHRPDALGYKKEDNSICIGEAKFLGDLSSSRTSRQIKDFISITKDKKIKAKVIFGIPLSEEDEFKKICEKNQIIFDENIIILRVPNRLLPENESI